MAIYWTDEQKAFKETAERFAKEQLAPGYQERDVEGQIDRSLTRAMGDLGLIGVDIPEEFGGLGQTCVTSGLITETIAYSDFNMSYMCLLGSLMGQIMVNHASADIAHEWVPQLLSGEKLIALGLTEPRGGSDAGNLILRADKKGDKYILNGEKTSIKPIRPKALSCLPVQGLLRTVLGEFLPSLSRWIFPVWRQPVLTI